MNIKNMPKVIDVSKWQGVINWQKVKPAISAAMIKVAGSDDGFYIDGYAQRNLIEARSAKVPIGTYIFLGGFHSVGEEVQHIINVYNELGGLRKGEPYCLDWERRRPGHDEVGYLTGIVNGLVRRGFPPPIIYMNLNYVRTQDWTNLVRMGCPLWIAAWGNNDAIPAPSEVPPSDEWKSWLLWQFSSTGTVPGIAGRVDLNLLNGDINTFKKSGQGVSANPGGSTSIPTPQDYPGTMEYIVKSGDTLFKIASRYGKSWKQLYAINRDLVANPDRIWTGQKLRVWTTGQTRPNPQLPTPTHGNGQKYHIVANGENLSVIAAKYGLSSWNTLYDMNRKIIGDNPHMIYPGQRLRIP